MVIVVTIVGIMATIAIPKFADAGSGRRLNAAKRTLTADVQWAQLRARATSKVHLIKFYTSGNRYVVFEGEEAKREAVVLVRDFDEDPYALSIKRTNLGVNGYTVVSVYGDISPGFTVGLEDDNVEILVVFGGVADFGVTPTITIPDDEAVSLGADSVVDVK